MPTPIRFRSLLAATVGLSLLAGCSTANLGVLASVGAAKGGVPFAATSAAAARLTSTSEVASPSDAQALATYDEGMIEATSATLEQNEASANYQLASLDDMFGGNFQGQGQMNGQANGNFFGPGGQGAPNGNNPPAGQMGPQGPQGQDGPDGQMGPMGPQGQGGPDGQRPQGPQGPGGRGGHGNFQAGAFGGGDFDGDMPAPPRLDHHAKPPVRNAKFEGRDRDRLNQNREHCKAQGDRFAKDHPQASQDEGMIQQVLDAQTWAASADDKTTVTKSGTNTLTLGNGTSRKIAVLRVVEAAAPHALVRAQTDIADKYADGAAKTVHWEKTLQADGSYSEAFHEEYTDPKGTKWVSDWTKTADADGKLTGSGTWTQTDANGKVQSTQTLTIGGDVTSGQTIAAGGAATTSASASASTDAAATATASAAPIAATANTNLSVPEDNAAAN